MYLQISDGTYEAYADILVQDEFVDVANAGGTRLCYVLDKAACDEVSIVTEDIVGGDEQPRQGEDIVIVEHLAHHDERLLLGQDGLNRYVQEVLIGHFQKS